MKKLITCLTVSLLSGVAISDTEVVTLEISVASSTGLFGHPDNDRFSINVPHGSEILQIGIENGILMAIHPSWASEAAIGFNIESEQYDWGYVAPFDGHDSSSGEWPPFNEYGPVTIYWDLDPGTYFCSDGTIDIEFFELYDDTGGIFGETDSVWNGVSWNMPPYDFPPHVLSVTYELHLGACCFSDVKCDEMSEYNCIGNGGNYLGNETLCANGGCDCTDPCGQPNCEQYDPCDTSCETYDPCICNPWDGCEFDCTLEPPYSAITIHCVPSEYPTIQEAIDAASEGDIIQVAPGNYGGFEIRKAVKVTGLRSTGTRPVIQAGGCLSVTNGGVLEFMEVYFSGNSCTPEGNHTGFISDIEPTLGVVRDCISHDGGATAFWAHLDFYDCQFLSSLPPIAFWVGGGVEIKVHNSSICDQAGATAGSFLAYTTAPGGCVNFTECLIYYPLSEYGDACFTDCQIFEVCPPDCNENGVPDIWDIANGTSSDKDDDGVPDECWFPDCNGNEIDDTEDVASGSSFDCDQNGVPDECQSDCDGDGWIDPCDNDADVDGDGIPDNCEEDCNGNAFPDHWEIEMGWAEDCNSNLVPDVCDVQNVLLDCNQNGLVDSCELDSDPTLDCDLDGILDSCTTDGGTVEDCNNNGIPDNCDLQDPANDQNKNGAIDYCECLADVNSDAVVNVHDLLIVIGYWGSSIPAGDINFDGIVNVHDLLLLIAAWGTCP